MAGLPLADTRPSDLRCMHCVQAELEQLAQQSAVRDKGSRKKEEEARAAAKATKGREKEERARAKTVAIKAL